jgi:Flp pilus assembly pilin Flp
MAPFADAYIRGNVLAQTAVGRRLYMLTNIRGYLKDERGAEMVEWVVVVVVLAVVASIVFGPNGVLMNAVKDGVNKISAVISALPTT